METKELRRLLELAAKAASAAGMDIIDSEAGPQIFERHASDGTECYRIWLPHSDDGDNRRLEVALGIDIYHREVVWASIAGRGIQVSEPYGIRRAAATRLVVLRAAAAIGEAMP